MKGRVAFLASGTAGHITPAVSVARELLEMGLLKDQIFFVGSPRALERELLSREGFKHVGAFRRHLEPRRLKAALAVAALPVEALYFGAYFKSCFVKAVVSLGAAASFAPAVGAALSGIPLVVGNIDLEPGRANEALRPFASAVLNAYPQSARRGEFLTGVPVRREVEEVGVLREDKEWRKAARSRYLLDPEAPVVGVMGGSLGARFLLEVALRLAEKDRVDVLCIIGKERLKETALPEKKRLFSLPYEDEIWWFYGACDLVISRAGAMATAELSASRSPALLVPLPGSPKNHQEKNALFLKEAGAAVLCSQSLGAEAVAEEAISLVKNRERLSQISSAQGRVFRGGGRRLWAEVISAYLEL